MRLRPLLLSAGFLLFSVPGTFSQNTTSQISSKDSLKGFDEAEAIRLLSSEGLTGTDLTGAIETMRRSYINHRFGFFEKAIMPSISSAKNLGGVASLNAFPCDNEGFESTTGTSTIQGWSISRGTNLGVGSNTNPTFTTGISPGTQATVVNTPFSDPFLTIPNSPFTGSKVIRINSTANVSQAPVIRIAQTVPVTATNFLYEFAFIAVMQNAASPPNTPHSCVQTPYMAVKMRDVVTNSLLTCPQFSFAAPATGGCGGFGAVTWSTVATNVMSSNGWQRFSIDLTAHIGSTITIEAYVAHCSLGGHWGYAYFDSNCNSMNVTVNGQSWPMPSSSVSPTVACGSTATLVGPGGLGPYQWIGPSGSGINSVTTQSISTGVAGTYTLKMTPPYVCNNFITRLINLSFVPPTTVTASPATICASGPNTISTLSAAGAANYTWFPGGVTGPTRTVSPTSTTIYTVTAQTGSCVGNFTTQLTVAPDPTVFASSSNPSVCSGGGSTLTAVGATSYTWFPGGMTGSQVAVNPGTPTTYTVVGSNPSGCQSSSTVHIGVSGNPNVGILDFTGTSTVCAGNPYTLVGLGATSFSWYPTSPLITTQVAALTPTATTQYTVIGSNGSCTNSAVHTITVNPGPSMTLAANPTITCPGINATLTANAPASLGFTWNPGGSNASSIVVNPAVTTDYSVTGINAAGCRSTYTISKLVAPVPTIAVTPATATVCAGNSILLTASGATSYTWNPGGVLTNTRLVSPAVNTTYTVTASNGTCSSTALKTVSVIPTPTVVASASSTNICRGQSTTLTATGAAAYTWQPGGSTAATVVVSPTTTTTYTLSGRTAGCSANSTITVIVRPQPTLTPVASPTAVCPGFCSTLSATGANTYTFSAGTVVCPAVTTTYSVTGTSTNGCVNTTPATISVVVNPTPNIVLSPSSASVCLGSSVTITATGASSYTWNPGNLTGASRALSPAATTVYTVTGTNAQGCISQRTIQISVVPLPTVSASASPTVICSGSTVTLSASGATTYTWMPGNLAGATRTVAPTISRVYTVTGNTAGCTDQETVSVTVNPRPNIGLSASPATVCPGFCSTLNPTGGSSYTFSPSGPTICPVSTGTYSVNGVNAFGCTDLTPPVITVVVAAPANFTVSSSTPSICAGGSATLTAAGASTYSWQPGNLTGASVVVSPTTSTTYTATGRTTAGCTTTRTISIVVVPTPTINTTVSPATICPGGTSSLSATGASSYTWMPGNLSGSNVTVSPAATGVYTVTGNSGGCSSTTTVAVVVLPAPSLVASASQNTVCNGGCSTLTVTGGTSYTWMPGSSTGSSLQACPAVSTVYTVTGTNASGCTGSGTVAVNVVPGITVSASASSPSICAGSNVTLTASGGTSYTWMPGSSTTNPRIVSPAITTIYTVTGVNASGCSGQATVQVVVVPLPVVNASANPAAICAGSSTTLSATGASVYIWNPGNLSGAVVSVTPAATTIYTVTATSSLGCSVQRTVQVTVNPLPVVSAAANPTAVCAGACTSLTATGATNYTWMPGNITGASVSVCPPASTIYTVTGRTAAGCSSTATVAVISNTNPIVSLSSTLELICAGDSAVFAVSGADTYLWMPGAKTGTFAFLSPSVTTVYTVTGTNSTTGCSGIKTLTVVVNPRPVVSISTSTNAMCAGTCATLTASGASTYTWSTGSNANPLVYCPSATTVISIQGTSSGCTSTISSITLTANPVPVINASASPGSICTGGSSTLSASGASVYSWMPGSLSGSLIVVNPPSTTVYSVTGFNSFGCSATQTVAVVVNPAPSVTITASTNSVCFGLPVVLTALGGTSFTWQPGGQNTQVITVNPTVTTVYTVTASNASGCTGQATYTVNVIPPPNVTASSSPTRICTGDCATLTASGASSYTWLPGFASGSSAVVCPTVTTTYTVIGQQGMCGNFTTITVPVSQLPAIFAVANPTQICVGGTATLSAGGGVSYTWNPGNLSGANVTVAPVGSTNYTVAASDGTCVNSTTVSLSVNPAASLTLTASSSTVCSGRQVTLTAGGGSGYTWLPGAVTGSSIAPTLTTSTIFTVNASSGPGGCPGSATIGITVVPNPTVTATASQTGVCPGTCTSLFATGATSYSWLPMNLTGSSVTVCPTSSSSYTVIGSAAGCTNAAAISVVTFTSPVITAAASPATICPGESATLTANGASGYTWFPGGSSGSQLVVNPAATTVYTVFGSSSTGCSGVGTVIVNVNPAPTISVTGAGTICAGSSQNLLASGASGNSYTWQPGSLTGSNVIVTPTSTTIYTVTGAQNNCTASATHTVSVNPLPLMSTLANPASICTNGASTLTAAGAASYTWQPVALTGSAIVVFPSVTTIYTVTGLSSAGCATTQTVVVSVSSQPSITVSSSNNTICTGSQATLTASGPISYTWLPINANGSVVTVSPGSTITYTIIGSNGPACTNTVTFVQAVSPMPTINISTPGNTVCAGFTTALTASGANSYTWEPGTITTNPATVTVTATTVYTVTGETNGCSSTASVQITAAPIPTVTASATPTSVCPGGTITLAASGANNYTWYPMSQAAPVVTAAPGTTTTYTVVGFSSNGCPGFATITVPVLTFPQLTVTASSASVCLGSTGTLTASGAVNYTWQPGNLTGSTVTVSPVNPTTYTVTGDNGACQGSGTISVGVNPLPAVTAAGNPTVVCAADQVTLTATGAASYTWQPGTLVGQTVTDNPTVSTVYTVTGEDANGCSATAVAGISVNPFPSITPVATPTGMCEGSLVTATLSVTGNAVTYTWQPSGSTSTLITDSPTVTTVYTVSGTDAIGCSGSATVMVGVFPIPTISIAPPSVTICAGDAATLTATGATNYSWMPGGGTQSVEIVSPLTSTSYTLIGDNGGLCSDTTTVDVYVNPAPAGVSASGSGTITCASPSATLSGAATDTDVIFAWTGPSGFTSTAQNPTVTAWGIYTLNVTNTITGCSATATVDIPTDNSIPSVTATVSGSITCSSATVTLNALHSTFPGDVLWSGPSGFTTSASQASVIEAGTYTVVVTDLLSSCTGSATVTVETHTEVTVTATITAATCSSGISLNNGTILVDNFGALDRFDLVAGTSYTGTLTYTDAISIPSSGIITNNLANPSDTVSFTLRIFDSLGCIRDYVLDLLPTDCTPKVLGIAKSVSTPTNNGNGTYNVMFILSATNFDSIPLSNVVLEDNLAAVIPAPATFTVSSLTTASPGGLILNASFDGALDTRLTTSLSVLSAGVTELFTMEVTITPNGFFGPFSNTVTGNAVTGFSVPVSDVSTNGNTSDPDNDGNPRNNSEPTTFSLTPQLFFGLTKVGTYLKQDNDTYDVSYTITAHNLGNDTVNNVVITDSLFNAAVRQPATYTIKSAPVANGLLTANSSFDGRFDINLVNPALSSLAPGTSASVSFTINVIPDTVTVLVNSAKGSATGKFDSTPLQDISNDGIDPDSNDNGIWNEAPDNIPTVLNLPPLTAARTQSVFVPEGFSPDGDGINDLFVIKGMPTTGENVLTVFNRWGNRVYQHGNYNNSWNGYPNVAGTFGSDKLPPGTYYYVLEFKSSGESRTGFIVLQY